LILLALTHLLTIAVAGLFSSRLISTTNEALLRSSKCGWLSEEAYKDFAQLTSSDMGVADALFLDMTWDFRRSAEYARSCYDSPTDGSSTLCDGLVVPRITSSIDMNVACPFDPQICRASAIRMDSNRIRTNQHLGINSNANWALDFRKVTSCAPLVGNGTFESSWSKTLPVSVKNNTVVPGEEFRYYYYGPSIHYGLPAGNEIFYYKKEWSAMQNEEYIMWYVRLLHRVHIEILS
jgi:hypothetical protein